MTIMTRTHTRRTGPSGRRDSRADAAADGPAAVFADLSWSESAFSPSTTLPTPGHPAGRTRPLREAAGELGRPGLGALLVTRCVPYWRWRGGALICWSSPLAAGGVFVPHVGSKINGGRRWIGYGQFQPSELAKLTLVLYLARLLSVRPENMQVQNGSVAAVDCDRLYGGADRAGAGLGDRPRAGRHRAELLFFAGARPRHMAGLFGGAVVLITLYPLQALSAAPDDGLFRPEGPPV